MSLYYRPSALARMSSAGCWGCPSRYQRPNPSRAFLDSLVARGLRGVEIDEKWAGQQQPYIKWDHQNA
jgi:hypothetical protein